MRQQRITVFGRLFEPFFSIGSVFFDGIGKSTPALIGRLRDVVVMHFLHKCNDALAAVFLCHADSFVSIQHLTTQQDYGLFFLLQILVDEGTILVYFTDIGDFFPYVFSVNEIFFHKDVVSKFFHGIFHLP